MWHTPARRHRLALLLVVGALAAPAGAQTPPVKNPTAVEFQSPDHALLTGYALDIVDTAGVVIQTLTTGLGTQAADGTVRLTLNVQPIAFGVYTLRVRAVAGPLLSVDSAPSDPWQRAPGPPSKPAAK